MPDPALQEAIDLAKQGNRKEAQTLAAQYLNANPQDVSGWAFMARIVDDPERALQCWQRAAALRPDDQRIKDEIAKLQSASSLDPLADFFDAAPSSATTTPAPAAKRPRSRLRTALLIAGGLLLFSIVACVGWFFVYPAVSASVNPCGRYGVLDTLAPLDAAYDEFSTQATIAANTPRMNLSVPLSDMQATYNNAQSLVVPPCAQEVHEALLSYMRLELASLTAFMAQEEDAVVGALMIQSAEAGAHYFDLNVAMLEKATGITPEP